MITGSTGSVDFPTTPGAVQSTFHGGTGTPDDVPTDAFAARLDPSGSRLTYSTYLGGSADDAGNEVALDHAGNAYFAGSTASPEFPTTPGALKTSLQPGTTLIGFVTKLDPAGRLLRDLLLVARQRDDRGTMPLDQREDGVQPFVLGRHGVDQRLALVAGQAGLEDLDDRGIQAKRQVARVLDHGDRRDRRQAPVDPGLDNAGSQTTGTAGTAELRTVADAPLSHRTA